MASELVHQLFQTLENQKRGQEGTQAQYCTGTVIRHLSTPGAVTTELQQGPRRLLPHPVQLDLGTL